MLVGGIFSFSPQYFQKACFAGLLKVVSVWLKFKGFQKLCLRTCQSVFLFLSAYFGTNFTDGLNILQRCAHYILVMVH